MSRETYSDRCSERGLQEHGSGFRHKQVSRGLQNLTDATLEACSEKAQRCSVRSDQEVILCMEPPC